MINDTGPEGWIPEESAKEAMNDVVDSFILAIDSHVDEETADKIKAAAEWEIIRRTFTSLLQGAQGKAFEEYGKGLS